MYYLHNISHLSFIFPVYFISNHTDVHTSTDTHIRTPYPDFTRAIIFFICSGSTDSLWLKKHHFDPDSQALWLVTADLFEAL